MKQSISHWVVILVAMAGLFVCTASAELGLQQIMTSQGAPAIGQSVLTAVKAIYASETDPAVVRSKITAILNEAAATGNEQIIRYTIVAVLMAGGPEKLDLCKAAIDDSDAFRNYKGVTASTVASVRSLMLAGGNKDGRSGRPGGQGGGQGGGDWQQGGGGRGQGPWFGFDPENPFSWWHLIGEHDNDLPATGV
jgi:hypothetical protein